MYYWEWNIQFLTGAQIKKAVSEGKHKYTVYVARPTSSTGEETQVQDGDVYFWREFPGGVELPKCFWILKAE